MNMNMGIKFALISVFKDEGIPEFSKEEESIETNEDDTPLKTMVLEQVNTGELCTPTDLVYQSCTYNYNFYITLHAH